MKEHLKFIVIGLFIFASSGSVACAQSQAIASQIIAREKALIEAWQRQDKAFFVDYLSDEYTGFGPGNPYMETDPKTNLLPKFEQLTEMLKIIHFQMYNPHVQVYGDVAILTYNEEVTIHTINYTGKVTTVYVKQGDRWRVVHRHESANPRVQ
jgi:ketosteroid isomerase-like protein